MASGRATGSACSLTLAPLTVLCQRNILATVTTAAWGNTCNQRSAHLQSGTRTDGRRSERVALSRSALVVALFVYFSRTDGMVLLGTD